jgi:nucleoside-diphosphate-sugar epimerase
LKQPILSIKRVVWSSSCAVISSLGEVFGSKLLDDTGIYGTKNFYGATKILCELMAKQYINNYGMEIISLRFPVVYGLGKATGWGAYFTEMMKNAALGNPATIRGGDSNWPYMYVEDVSMATIKASQVLSTCHQDIKSSRRQVLHWLGTRIKRGFQAGYELLSQTAKLASFIDFRKINKQIGEKQK